MRLPSTAQQVSEEGHVSIRESLVKYLVKVCLSTDVQESVSKLILKSAVLTIFQQTLSVLTLSVRLSLQRSVLAD